MSIANSSTITDLRQQLFAALKGLSDKSMPLDRAKAIAEISQVIINTAKVEVDFLKVTGGKGSGFIPTLPMPSDGKGGNTIIEERPGVRVVQHKLAG